MSSPFTALNTTLGSVLQSSTALTGALGGTAIYYMQAPDAQAYPYVIFSYQSSIQENIEPSQLHQTVVYIRVYDTNLARAGTVDGIIDGLIDGKTLTLSGSWVNYWSAREDEVSLVESAPNQIPVYNVGAFYRINLDK